MKLSKQDVSVVYREDAHGEGRYDRWVGLRIGEIVQWYAHTDCYSDDEQYAAVEKQLHAIARAARGEG